jgi:hypothetical protein
MPSGRYANYNFPRGKILVHPITIVPNTNGKMRWTGLADSNWHNPYNWVEVKDGYEAPARSGPSNCVDVIISKEATNYPALIDASYGHTITMEDRAMLKNPHVLHYDSAKVEIKLQPSERDRFILWSAPLQSVYSGDYHFKK